MVVNTRAHDVQPTDVTSMDYLGIAVLITYDSALLYVHIYVSYLFFLIAIRSD